MYRYPLILIAITLTACAPKAMNCPPCKTVIRPEPMTPPGQTPCKPAATATAEAEATAFFKETEAELLTLWSRAARAAWIKMTYITSDTQALEVEANEAVMTYTGNKAAEAQCRFGEAAATLTPALVRKLNALRASMSLPAPADAHKAAELARLDSAMESAYGKGKYCPPRLKGKCLTLGQLSEILTKSRKPDELLEAWVGWRTISPPMRDQFTEVVALANEGARRLGFKDVGELWRARFDMSPAAMAKEVDRLWLQVKPLYKDLHCFVRQGLQKTYGKKLVPDGAPIPAHLLGNMWSQDWLAIKDTMGLGGKKKHKGTELDRALVKMKMTPTGMAKAAEKFFVSLGLPPLPETFWKRSMFEKPRDRDVVCHAYAFDVDYKEDLRIKMCIKINGEDYTTVHHELGHNYYDRAYSGQDPLFRDSAHPGFHEGLGDTISLSVTPGYLVKMGLLAREPKNEIEPLLDRALEKVAFLPFGVLMDRWRWAVYSGEVGPDAYTSSWWAMREKYQGVKAPAPRTEKDFDPGSKYHIAANYPYTRYFLATVLQFQFHRALCQAAGYKGPLHKCSIYGNKEAGKRLDAMMAMGASRPWTEALQALGGAGEDKMDATAILDYFKPLHTWLKAKNKGRECGW